LLVKFSIAQADPTIPNAFNTGIDAAGLKRGLRLYFDLDDQGAKHIPFFAGRFAPVNPVQSDPMLNEVIMPVPSDPRITTGGFSLTNSGTG